MRCALLVMMLPLIGCSRAEGNSSSSNVQKQMSASEIAQNYRSLRLMTAGPVYLNPELASLCTGVTQEQVARAQERAGPHAHTTVRIYMNDLASDSYARTADTYPAGSIIVKEKRALPYETASSQPRLIRDGVGGMIKRLPGYDPQHGDWEYFYFESPAQIESGKIASCVRCHDGAGHDHIFGKWGEADRN